MDAVTCRAANTGVVGREHIRSMRRSNNDANDIHTRAAHATDEHTSTHTHTGARTATAAEAGATLPGQLGYSWAPRWVRKLHSCLQNGKTTVRASKHGKGGVGQDPEESREKGEERGERANHTNM